MKIPEIDPGIKATFGKEPALLMAMAQSRETTARTDLLTLAKKGYLEKIKSGHAFHFIVTSDLPNKAGNQTPDSGDTILNPG